MEAIDLPPINYLRSQRNPTPRVAASLKEILPGAAITSTCWGDVEIRVYFQDADHAIREFKCKNGWGGGSMYDITSQARPNSPLAIAQWMCGEQSEIRVYSLARGGGIRESCWSGSAWYTGALDAQKIVPTPSSKLAASEGPCGIFVYYQVDDNRIREYNISDASGWRPGQQLPTDLHPPLRGTSIASIYWGNISKRIFYQEGGGLIRELKGDRNGWSVGSAVCQAKLNTPLAVIQWGEASRKEIRLYYLDENNIIQEYCHSGSTWFKGHSAVVAAPCSKLGAVFWNLNIRVYYQPDGCTDIHELVCIWGRWSPGAQLRIPGSQAVDSNGATYTVNYLPYILDLVSWQSYDPSTIDGVGVLIGCIDGQIFGEELSTMKTKILRPSTGGNSYAWVYAPGSAIIYRSQSRDNKGDYVRHSQLGSGEPVICAGEFRIDKTNRLESVVAMVSGACLIHVARKFENLGISTSGTSWYWK